MPVFESGRDFRAVPVRYRGVMMRWLGRLLAETAWPPASDEWLKDLVR
jgi:hypothetical protein